MLHLPPAPTSSHPYTRPALRAAQQLPCSHPAHGDLRKTIERKERGQARKKKIGAAEHQAASTEKKTTGKRAGLLFFLKLARTPCAAEEPSCSSARRKCCFCLQLGTGLHPERCFATRRQLPLRQRPLRAPTWALGSGLRVLLRLSRRQDPSRALCSHKSTCPAARGGRLRGEGGREPERAGIFLYRGELCVALRTLYSWKT